MLVLCPCCNGTKRLTVVEHDEVDGRTWLEHPKCTHCMGKGVVEAEVDVNEA
jgi:hypothetical protein